MTTPNEAGAAILVRLFLVVLIIILAFTAGWGLGRNQLYHEIFMEDVELEVVPLDSLPERIGTTTRSA